MDLYWYIPYHLYKGLFIVWLHLRTRIGIGIRLCSEAIRYDLGTRLLIISLVITIIYIIFKMPIKSIIWMSRLLNILIHNVMLLLQLVVAKAPPRAAHVTAAMHAVSTVFAIISLDSLRSIALEFQPLLKLC